MPGTTGKTIGGYTLLREIGRGGMSTVHAARDERDGQTVALKLLSLPAGLSPEQQRDLIARFAREARAVAGLSHPGIVAIRDVGEQDGQHFLVMECLDGQTLRGRLAQGPLTPAQALPILTQVADALDAVHAQGVVHRDVKPTNVMLLPDGTAKLLDFGIARQSDDTTITSTGAIVGSPAYLSPEQVRGELGTPASDRWALGVLLYEMLAGRPPFNAETIPAVLYQVTHENPAPVPGLTSPTQRVLRRALDKNPERRFPTARALADTLRRSLPEVSPAPPRRMRRPWLALLLVPVLLGLGLVALTRHRQPSSRPSATPVPSPLPAATLLTPQTPTARLPRRPAPHHAPKPRPRHKKSATARPAHKHATPPRRHSLAPRHHEATRRRRQHRRAPFFHPRAPRRSGDRFDPAASAQLQKFIYGEGR